MQTVTKGIATVACAALLAAPCVAPMGIYAEPVETVTSAAATLQVLINDADNGATIEVSQSVTESISIPAGKTITLNIPAGVTLTGAADEHAITNNGVLTITGAGTITTTATGKAALFNTGTVHLNGAHFVRGDAGGYYTVENQGVMTVTGATIEHTGTSSSCVRNGWENGTLAAGNTASLTIVSGTVKGGMNAVKNDAAGVLSVQGGNISCSYSLGNAVANWSSASITGGTVTSSANDAIANCANPSDSTSCGKMEVSGGTVTTTAADKAAVKNNSAQLEVSGSAQLKGAVGIMNNPTKDPSVNPAPNAAKVVINGGSITGTKTCAVGAGKGTLEVNGGSLKLSETAIPTGAYVIAGSGGSKISINNGDFFAPTGQALIILNTNSTAEINGGTFEMASSAGGTAGYSIYNKGGKLTVNDGSFSSANTTVFSLNSSAAVTSIDGGSFNNTKGGATLGVKDNGTSATVTAKRGTYSDGSVVQYMAGDNIAFADKDGNFTLTTVEDAQSKGAVTTITTQDGKTVYFADAEDAKEFVGEDPGAPQPEPIIYTVNFVPGKGASGTFNDQQVNAMGTVTEYKNPVREGYDFLGWFLDGSETPYVFSTPVTSNLTLTAKWAIKKYNVEFDLAGGTGEIATAAVEHGAQAVAPTAPMREGYHFVCWMNGDAKYDFETAVTSDLKLSAKWEINTYTVDFDLNGGKGDVRPQTVEHGNRVVPLVAPARVGYRFAGWTLDGNAYDLATPVTDNLTLTAQWIKTYSVTFVYGTDAGEKVIVVDEDALAVAPEPPTFDGYTFVGWFTVMNEDGTLDPKSLFDFENTAINEDITLYGGWIKDEKPSIPADKPADKPTNELPKTGDASMLMVAVSSIAGASALAAGYVASKRRK